MIKVNISIFLLIFSIYSEQLSRNPKIIPPLPEASFSEATFENGLGKWGFWAMSPNLGTFEISDTKPHSGTKCGKLTISNIAPEIWHVQLQQRNFPVVKNHIYKLSYWIRGENGANIIEAVFVKGSPPWSFYSSKKCQATANWTKHDMFFTAPYTTTDIQLAFQCAHAKGDYYIDDITFEETGVLELKQLTTDWYTNAEQRIDSIRKDNFIIKITGGTLPKTGKVVVALQNHDFPFGTCLNFHFNAEDTKYKKIALQYFNCGVFENAFKWEEYERENGKPNAKELLEYIKWSEKNNFPIRGHTLFWGTENYGFNRHWARMKDDAFLIKSMKQRVQRDLVNYKGKIREYDVWNEPIHETSLFNRLGMSILDSSFIWAHKADPDAKLFINEYSIISGSDAKIYRDLVDDLLRRNIPVHGIGVQGHFSTLIDPLDVASKLYYMGESGLPIKVTEFDMDVRGLGLNDSAMAAEYAKILRTAFSHPNVEGFMFWGFSDARHWRNGAGIFDEKLQTKRAADSVYHLIHKQWTTKDTLTLDKNGEAHFRGFYGTYTIDYLGDSNKKLENAVFLKSGDHKKEFKIR
jgi:endo-1,4-beta-xylanase